MNPFERTLLRELFHDAEFAGRVVPYLREEYFYSEESALIYRLFAAFFDKFRTIPQFAAIRIGLDSAKNITEQQAKAAAAVLDEVEKEPELRKDQQEWLLEETEEFCQERAVYVGLQECIKVMDDPKATRHVIPDIMKQALAVSFDTHVGHDFDEDADARWEFYHRQEERIPFDLNALNKMTKGGVPKKTLNCVMAGTNVGKSLFLTHTAAAYKRFGKNVLYITLEMAEERIAERIDANMMNIPLDDLELMPRSDYIRKIHHLRTTSPGRVIIKEYPTAGAHAGHFRALINELKLKQNFVPDAIMIDYLTICLSSRVKPNANANSYAIGKAIAEELRGLAVEFNCPVWAGVQFNRSGHSSSNPDITDVGESWAIAQTADFMFALVQTEDLEKLGQVMVQPMKNRYQKKNSFQQELLGIDTPRMKLYDLSAAQVAQSVSLPPPGVAPSNSTGKSFGGNRRRPLKALKQQAGDDD